jgi:hypothetical protein
MGIITQPARALSQQVISRASNFCTARFATGLRRVNPAYNSDNQSTATHRHAADSRSVLTQCRSYATATVTATVKTPGKPKAHTGRTTTTKRKTATTTKKPAAKKATSTTKPKPKPKTRTKAKAKPKPKPRKRVLTEKQAAARAKLAASQKAKTLRTTALLTAPRGLPTTAWQVLITEAARNKPAGDSIGASSTEAAAKYKNLTPEERETLNHTAVGNKAASEAAHKQWLLSFTPKQIKEANTARLALNRQSKSSGTKKRIPRLQDDRLVRSVMSAYTYFFVERNQSGDMTGMKVGEIGGLIGKEWKALSASARKVRSLQFPQMCLMANIPVAIRRHGRSRQEAIHLGTQDRLRRRRPYRQKDQGRASCMKSPRQFSSRSFGGGWTQAKRRARRQRVCGTVYRCKDSPWADGCSLCVQQIQSCAWMDGSEWTGHALQAKYANQYTRNAKRLLIMYVYYVFRSEGIYHRSS